MGKTLTGAFGVMFGLIAGAAVGYLMYHNMQSTTIQRIVAGAVAGGIAGMFGGTIGGDFGKQESHSSRNVLAIAVGGVMGAIAASQAHVISELLPVINIRSGL